MTVGFELFDRRRTSPDLGACWLISRGFTTRPKGFEQSSNEVGLVHFHSVLPAIFPRSRPSGLSEIGSEMRNSVRSRDWPHSSLTSRPNQVDVSRVVDQVDSAMWARNATTTRSLVLRLLIVEGNDRTLPLHLAQIDRHHL